MPTELSVRAEHQGEMRIVATVRDQSVRMDYPMPPDLSCDGVTPLETLLASLAGCSGNSLALLLRRDEQPFTGIEVSARGRRREEHPTVITAIDLEFVVHGAVEPAAVEHALMISEKHICPVWAMLKDSTPIRATYRIVD